jgi:hypothetical protein
MKAMVERGGSMRELVERALGLTARPGPRPDAKERPERLGKRLH